MFFQGTKVHTFGASPRGVCRKRGGFSCMVILGKRQGPLPLCQCISHAYWLQAGKPPSSASPVPFQSKFLLLLSGSPHLSQGTASRTEKRQQVPFLYSTKVDKVPGVALDSGIYNGSAETKAILTSLKLQPVFCPHTLLSSVPYHPNP